MIELDSSKLWWAPLVEEYGSHAEDSTKKENFKENASDSTKCLKGLNHS